ncbi:PAS domain S-box protein [bacterium]|nr:PAS domain S-box protein [bacterium]
MITEKIIQLKFLMVYFNPIRPLFQDFIYTDDDYFLIDTGNGFDYFNHDMIFLVEALKRNDHICGLSKQINGFIFLCVFLIATSDVYGLNTVVEFENPILFRGQNSLTVFSISQDSSGYIWIGSNKGLFRYDGITYKRYTHRDNDSHSIFSNMIFRTNVDPQGVLWISGNDAFARYDAVNDSFQSYYLDSMLVDHSVISSRAIYDIVSDSSSLWVGLMAGAVYRFDKSDESFEHILTAKSLKSSGKKVTKISLSKSNQHIYCTIYNEIFKIDMKSFLIDTIAPDISGLSGQVFYPNYFTTTKNLWIGNNKLELFSISNNTITKIISVNKEITVFKKNRLILKIQEDSNGNLWIATSDHGLVFYNTAKGAFTYSIDNNSNIKGVNKNSIGTVFIDNTGTIWVGASAQGLFKSIKSHSINNIESISDGDNIIQNDNILFMNILCDDTALCFIDKEGLFIFCPDDELFHRISSNATVNQYFMSLTINNMITLKNRYVWFATEQGLVKLDRKTNQIDQFLPDQDCDDQKYGNYISALTITNDSTLWLGTYTGALFQFDIVSSRFVRRFNPEYQLAFNRLSEFPKYEEAILSIEKESDNELWIGTSNSGLGLFDISKGICTKTYTLGNSATQSIYSIDYIKRDSEGDIWIAVKTYGFYKYDKINDNFAHYFDEEGLISNNITSITEDSIHQLWLGTENGLVLFDKHTDLFTYFDTTSNFMCYDKTLNDIYLNSVREKSASHSSRHFPGTLKGLTLTNGTSIFYGPNGISYFNSKDFNSESSPIMLSDFKIFNTSQKYPIPIHDVRNIEMSYKDYIFSFEYRIIDYNNPKNNKYAFWLAGFEKEWNYTNNENKVTYFNIPPGKYIMKAIGYNSVGAWNEKPVEIGITITPPFWQTWWFRIMVGLSVAGLVGFAFWFRIHQIQEQKKLLEVQVRQRTNELHESNEQLTEEIQFRKKAEAELRKSEEEYRDLFDNAYDVIWISDIDGKIQAINHFFQDLLGYPKNEIIGTALLNYISPEHRFRAIRNYLKFKQEHLIECELNFKTRDNGIRILWLKVRGIYENGGIVGIHGIGRDSTELKMAQAELQEAERMKRESMKQLTLKLAHEIKNPLTSITSSAQLVASSKDTRENPKIQRHMNIINKNVNICNHVIRELYSFTHKPELNLTVIQIPVFIADLRSYAESKIETNSLIKIKTAINESVNDILGDKFRLEQAFSNIINNAFDAMPEAGTLSINAYSSDDTVCIEISDTGCGMSEETIQNIFKPFYTLKASGFGLGMPVVKDIIDAHQGSINITSKPGQGSTFSLYFNAYFPKAD